MYTKNQNAAERDQEVTFGGVSYYITSTVSMPKVSRCLTRIAFAMVHKEIQEDLLLGSVSPRMRLSW